ncbi:MAG: serpin family protein [Saccharofermentanales bacterium]
MNNRIASFIIIMILLTGLLISTPSCSVFTVKVQADDLMKDISAKTITGKEPDDVFIKNYADFAFKIFQKTVIEDDNSMISPVSLMLSLAMTANGADNSTLSQMQSLLGGGQILLNDLNRYLFSYAESLPDVKKSKFKIANSIWFRDNEDRLTVEQEFLQTNADFYGAAAFKAPFDGQTLKDINNWVRMNTDKTIDKILDEIDADTVMYIINAIVFDAVWKNVYRKNDLYSDSFIDSSGKGKNTRFMRSTEKLYLENDDSTGFIKPYFDDKYSFVALLPDEGIPVKNYIESLTGDVFLDLMKNVQRVNVSTAMPKFRFDFSVLMNDTLKQLGMPDAFSDVKADFSRLGKSSRGNLYIGEVLHKTYISVDELGTRAGAVTKIEIKDKSGSPRSVVLNRPFVFAVIDNSTNLPVFLGTLKNID